MENVAAELVNLNSNLDDDLKSVSEMFPKLDNDWIRLRLSNGVSVEVLVNYILQNPEAIPTKPKVLQEKKVRQKVDKADEPSGSGTKTSETKTNIRSVNNPKAYFRYLDTSIEMSGSYQTASLNSIANRFPKIALNNLRILLGYFSYHYAPTVICLHETLENYNVLHLAAGTEIPVKDRPFVLTSLANRRVKRHVLLPEELAAEIEWTENYMKNKENQDLAKIVNGEETVCENKIECGICFDEFLLREMWPCDDGHLFCTECLRNHAKECVYGQGRATLTCLEIDCKTSFCREVLEQALNEDLLKKLDERQQEESLNMANIENLIKCKFCNCGVIVDVPVEVDKVFRCINPECEKQVCRICDMDWDEHIGIPCKEFETKDEERLRKEMEEKMYEAVVRRCNKCKAELIKETGCNKMTCRCGAKMCYVCRQPDIEYDHFCRHLRSPGKSCKACNACSLWEDATKLDKENLVKLKAEAEQAQSSLGTGRNRLIGVENIYTPPKSDRPLLRARIPPPGVPVGREFPLALLPLTPPRGQQRRNFVEELEEIDVRINALGINLNEFHAEWNALAHGVGGDVRAHQVPWNGPPPAARQQVVVARPAPQNAAAIGGGDVRAHQIPGNGPVAQVAQPAPLLAPQHAVIVGGVRAHQVPGNGPAAQQQYAARLAAIPAFVLNGAVGAPQPVPFRPNFVAAAPEAPAAEPRDYYYPAVYHDYQRVQNPRGMRPGGGYQQGHNAQPRDNGAHFNHNNNNYRGRSYYRRRNY